MRHLRMIGLTLAAALFAGQANAEQLTGTLKNIKETGTITLGFRDSSIPFSYLDNSQKPIGFAMDICYRIVDAVKKELKLDKLDVKLNPVTSSTRIPLLANGTIDLECGSTTNNAEREKQVAFTNTHFLPASRFVSKKSAKINSIDDLKESRWSRPPAPPTSSNSRKPMPPAASVPPSSPPRTMPKHS